MALTGQAQAQKYYARQIIQGISSTAAPATETQTITYTPIYSDTYSTCVGGTQDASITGCTGSDGKSAAQSNCSSFPQTKSRTCTSNTSTCSVPIVNSGPVTSPGIVNIGPALTAAEAQKSCNDYLARMSITTPGLCYHVERQTQNTYNNRAAWIPGATLKTPYGNGTDHYASSCSK